jgi:hypothetical protein
MSGPYALPPAVQSNIAVGSASDKCTGLSFLSQSESELLYN